MNTYGWDTVSICALDRVNASLDRIMTKRIRGFEFHDDDVKLHGVFAPWRLVRGGSNKYLHFETPIKTGTLQAYGESYDLSGVTPVMQLQLAFIDNAGSADVKDLDFDFRTVGREPGDATPGAVTTITPDTGDRLQQIDPVGIIGGVLGDALPRILIANKDDLSCVFASINLIPPEAASWLAPKRFDYHYAESATGQDSYLALLSTVTDRDVSALPRKIDDKLMSPDHELGFAVSGEMFLRHIVMPGLPAAYGHGATKKNFQFADGTIRNKGKLRCGKVTNLGIDYHPHIDKLELKVDGSALKTAATGSFPILLKSHINFKLGSNNKCTFDPRKQSVSFKKDPHPSHHATPKINTWEKLVGIIGGPEIAIIVLLIIDLVVDSAASSVTKALNKGGKLTVAKAAPLSFQWSGMEDFEVGDAGLSDAFYIRGRFSS